MVYLNCLRAPLSKDIASKTSPSEDEFETSSKKITADLLRMIKKLTSELQLKFKNDQQGDLWKPQKSFILNGCTSNENIPLFLSR